MATKHPKGKRNPKSSEEEWAWRAGVEYGEAVAQNAEFDGAAAFAYMRENYRTDLEDELTQIQAIERKSFGTDNRVSARTLVKTMLDGVKRGIEATISEHVPETKPEPPEPAIRRGVIDAGYATHTPVQHAPARVAPATPVVHRQRPIQKRAAAATAGYMKRASGWLDAYAARPNPQPIWIARVKQYGLPATIESVVEFLIESGVDVQTVIFALADTSQRVFAYLWPRMPNAEALEDTLDLVRFTDHAPTLLARAAYHENTANGLPCEQAARHVLNMAILASKTKATERTRERIIRMTNSVLKALLTCLRSTELDSHAEVWDTLGRALIKQSSANKF